MRPHNGALMPCKGVHSKSVFSILLIMTLVIFIASCSSQDDIVAMPGILKIGILPDEDEEVLLKRYTPLLQYLSKQLDIPYALKIPANYEELLEQFARGDIDLAYFGGFTFLQASDNSNAIPLVMRDIDTRFSSYFISRTDTSLKRIADFRGKRFSFGSRLSTSGHLMPRFFLQELKIVPEQFFGKVQYSGAHDATAFWVRDGVIDIGSANSRIIDSMFREGRLNQDEINILWETPPYPNYVWAIQSGFEQSTRTKIRNAFLSLSPSSKQHAEILAGMDTGGFLPASADDFEQLHEITHQLDMLDTILNHHQ
jgi:phosphonate transport system substrate-binding protein